MVMFRDLKINCLQVLLKITQSTLGGSGVQGQGKGQRLMGI